MLHRGPAHMRNGLVLTEAVVRTVVEADKADGCRRTVEVTVVVVAIAWVAATVMGQ
jgi:hypothetical protein